MLTSRFVDASPATIRIYFWRDPDPERPDDPPVQDTVQRVDLFFDGTAAGNGNNNPIFLQPVLPRHMFGDARSGSRLTWLQREGSTFLYALLPSLPWSHEEILLGATGSLSADAFRTPAHPATARMWLVTGSAFIPCSGLGASLVQPFDGDVSLAAFSCVPHAGDEPAFRIVLELAGALNFTRDGLPDDALLPIPIPGPPPPDSPFYGETADTASFALRQPPWPSEAIGPDLYEPSPDAVAFFQSQASANATSYSSTAGTQESDRWGWNELWDVQFSADQQMQNDITSQRVSRCRFGSSDYPLAMRPCSELAIGGASSLCLTCVGVNETALAADLVPLMLMAPQPSDMVVSIYLAFWWANVLVRVSVPNDPAALALHFWRRPKLDAVVPGNPGPLAAALISGRNLCTVGDCAGDFVSLPAPQVLFGEAPASSVMPLSTSALQFISPPVPRLGTPEWPVVRITVRNSRGYESINALTTRYPDTEVMLQLASAAPPFFVPCDETSPVELPTPLTVRAARLIDPVDQIVEVIAGRGLACNVSSRTAGATLMRMQLAGSGAVSAGASDVFASALPHNASAAATVVFPPFAALAQFSVSSVRLQIACSFVDAANDELQLLLDLPAAPLRTVMCSHPQPAVLSQEPLAPWSLRLASSDFSGNLLPGVGNSDSPDSANVSVCGFTALPPRLPPVLAGKVVCSVHAANESQAASQGSLFLTGASAVPNACALSPRLGAAPTGVCALASRLLSKNTIRLGSASTQRHDRRIRLLPRFTRLPHLPHASSSLFLQATAWSTSPVLPLPATTA